MALSERGRRLFDGIADKLPAMFKGKDGTLVDGPVLGALLGAVAATVGEELDDMEKRLDPTKRTL